MNSNVPQKNLDRHIEKPNLERKNRGVSLTNPFIFRGQFYGRGQKKWPEKWAMVSFYRVLVVTVTDVVRKKWSFGQFLAILVSFVQPKVGREIGLKRAFLGIFGAKMGIFGPFLSIFRHFLMKFRVCGQKPTFFLYLI